MRRKSYFLYGWVLGLTVSLLVSCAPLPVSPPGTRPVITNAFINKERGRYGDILKIYLEADDPRGYMSKVITVVDQVGYGRYFPDTTYLEKQYEHRVIGYLQWNTFSPHASSLSEWTRITIKVSISDTDGHESNTVAFPFIFVSEGGPERPVPPPFDRGTVPRLGYININLYEPTEMGGDEGIEPD
jgi:hypothetical protein